MDVRWSFPVVGSLAPVLLSVGMWLITQSPMALIFAGLGPLMAVGSYVDARRTARKKRRSESERFLRELRHGEVHGEQIHSEERRRLNDHLPSAIRIVSDNSVPRAVWRSVARGEIALTLGRGALPSGIDLKGVHPKRDPEGGDERALAAFVRKLRTVHNVPVELILSPNLVMSAIGVCGPDPVVSAYARSMLVQIMRLLSPSRYGITVRSAQDHGHTRAWEWLNELPHPLITADRAVDVAGRIDIRIEPLTSRVPLNTTLPPGTTTGEHAIVISIASMLDDLPAGLDAMIVLEGAQSDRRFVAAHETRIVQHLNPEREGPIVIEVISIEQAVHWARSLRALATREGLVVPTSEAIPERVMLADLLARTAEQGLQHPDVEKMPTVNRSTLRSLACAFAVGPDGDEIVDLVIDGPHAIIGGTTGSGKSELLISWVAAMATRYSAHEVNFLLVDYKGGASFEALTKLPHCVGVLTDLDEVTSKRALDSLAAELRFRERALSNAGAKSIVDMVATHGLARLVIVVDEFAAMAAEHPELHALFSDIAARGRSLGVHLILCTQRPAGVIRDAVLANSELRISLRVNNAADSVAVVGDDSAARLPARILGRAVLARAGEQPRHLQLGLLAPADLDTYVIASNPTDEKSIALVEGHHPEPRQAEPRQAEPRRPWLDPLADSIALRDLVATSCSVASPESELALVFGVSDHPEEQAQPLARYEPRNHGHLLIVGDALSGKSTALSALRETASTTLGLDVVRVFAGVEALWDTVTLELARVRSASAHRRRLILMDDVDAILSRAGDEYERELAETLSQLLREGPSAGTYCVITMRRVSGAAAAVAAMMGSRLVLAHASRQEFILAGGAGEFFQPRMSPGRAQWNEHRAQVALPTPFTDWLKTVGNSESFDNQEAAGRAQSESFTTTGSFAVVAADPVSITRFLSERFIASGSDHEVLQLGPSGTPGEPSISITSGSRPRVIIGTPEKWQSYWGALETVSTHWPVVVIGCSVMDFRSVTRGRILPPPADFARGDWWLLRPGIPVVRAQFESPDPAATRAPRGVRDAQLRVPAQLPHSLPHRRQC